MPFAVDRGLLREDGPGSEVGAVRFNVEGPRVIGGSENRGRSDQTFQGIEGRLLFPRPEPFDIVFSEIEEGGCTWCEKSWMNLR